MINSLCNHHWVQLWKNIENLPKLWARIVFDSRVLDEFSPHTYETWCPTVFHQIYRAACFTSTLQLLQQPVHFKSHFPGETGLAMCPTLWFSCSIYYWSVCPPGTGPTLLSLTRFHQVFLWCSICHVPSTSVVIQCFTQSVLSLHYASPNLLSLPSLITRLTGFRSNNSMIHSRCHFWHYSSRVSILYGIKVHAFPLTWDVTVSTVLCYYTAVMSVTAACCWNWWCQELRQCDGKVFVDAEPEFRIPEVSFRLTYTLVSALSS